MKKFDTSEDVKKDTLNTSDKVWYLPNKIDKYIAIIIEINTNEYTIAYFDNKHWEIITTTYETLFPRVREKKEESIFEIFDTVYIVEPNSKTFGVVIGFESYMHIIMKYANKIWRRVVVPGKVLEHTDDNFDDILFNNRKLLLEHQDWIKWNLPNG